jgi:hypothetical protein
LTFVGVQRSRNTRRAESHHGRKASKGSKELGEIVTYSIGKTRFAATLLGAFVLVASLALLPRTTFAGSLDPSVVSMFPKDSGELAYADLKSARALPWFPQLREQLLPSNFRKFEQFLTTAGIDPNTQVDELAWAAIAASKNTSETIVGVALGSFDPSDTEDRLKAKKLAMTEYAGFHMYAFGSGSGSGDIYFTFIDSNTAAFGQRSALQELLDVRTGAAESLMMNDDLSPLINEANGSGMVWAVLDQNYTHLAMQQLVPQASQFPQATAIINRMKAMTISVQADSGLDAQFQAVCGSPDDSQMLAAALQAGLMMRRYQEAQAQPDLAGALDHVTVSPSGDRLKVDAPVSQDQLLSLIRSKALATSM